MVKKVKGNHKYYRNSKNTVEYKYRSALPANTLETQNFIGGFVPRVLTESKIITGQIFVKEIARGQKIQRILENQHWLKSFEIFWNTC